VTANNDPQFFRQCEYSMEVRNWKQLGFATLKPATGIGCMTLWAAAIAAGMVNVVAVAALIAFAQIPAKNFGTTGGNIAQGAAMTRQHPFPESKQIIVTISAENIRKFWHGLIARLQVVHKLVNTLVQIAQDLFGQMGIDSGGLRSGMTENILNHAQISASL